MHGLANSDVGLVPMKESESSIFSRTQSGYFISLATVFCSISENFILDLASFHSPR